MNNLGAKEIVAAIVFMLMLSANAQYIVQIIRKKISPTLSTWIMFSTATALNAASYLKATDGDVVSGVLGLSDAMICFLIVISIVVFTRQKTRFKPFEKYYLLAAGVVVLFWLISVDAFTTNLLVQLLILVGYFPTVQNLLAAEKNPESFVAWGLVLLASMVSLYPAISGDKVLAIIYSIRSMVMVSFVLILMYRLKTRKERQK